MPSTITQPRAQEYRREGVQEFDLMNHYKSITSGILECGVRPKARLLGLNYYITCYDKFSLLYWTSEWFICSCVVAESMAPTLPWLRLWFSDATHASNDCFDGTGTLNKYLVHFAYTQYNITHIQEHLWTVLPSAGYDPFILCCIKILAIVKTTTTNLTTKCKHQFWKLNARLHVLHTHTAATITGLSQRPIDLYRVL